MVWLWASLPRRAGLGVDPRQPWPRLPMAEHFPMLLPKNTPRECKQMTPRTLLLVDDDRLVLDGMATWLREQGYDVHAASGRETAIGQLKERRFDLVLADIRLADGDGFEILAHCRQHYPHTTVVLITGYATVETGIEALRAGAFDLITKPLIDEELSMAIDRALTQRD